MSKNKSEIAHIIGGDFSAFDFYADDYEGVRDPEIYDDVNEAQIAFAETIKEKGLLENDYMHISNYINPIRA